MAEQSFDLVVLGGGSGGYAAALRAVELGSTVALIEKDKLGGRVCIVVASPPRHCLHAAEVADVSKESAKYGVNADLRWHQHAGGERVQGRGHHQQVQGLARPAEGQSVTVIAGEGRLVAANAVQVGDDRYIGTNVVLATGSYSRSLPGLEIGRGA